jgi:hypothetical protein
MDKKDRLSTKSTFFFEEKLFLSTYSLGPTRTCDTAGQVNSGSSHHFSPQPSKAN